MHTMVRTSVSSAVLFALVFVWGSSARTESAQSLAEVAKRERDRRARVEKESEPAPVIGREELEAFRGASRSVSGNQPSRETEGKGASEAAAPATDAAPGESRLTDKEARELRATWARVWRERMEQAQAELETAQDDVYQCRSASRYFFVPLAIDCDGVDERLAEAEARFREVKQNRYNWELLLPGAGKEGTP